LSEILPPKRGKYRPEHARPLRGLAYARPLRGLADSMARYQNSPDKFGAEIDVLGQNLTDCDLQTSTSSECEYCQPIQGGNATIQGQSRQLWLLCPLLIDSLFWLNPKPVSPARFARFAGTETFHLNPSHLMKIREDGGNPPTIASHTVFHTFEQ